MKLPKIAIILKGRPDKNNKKLLYIRYSILSKTNWLSLGISVAESNWDAKRRMVKSRDVDSAKLNQIINASKFEAEQLALDFLAQSRDQVFTFELFKKKFLKTETRAEKPHEIPIAMFLATINEMLSEKAISSSTHEAYRAAVNMFIRYELVNTIDELTPVIVNTFRREMIKNRNENVAAQYVRNVAVVFRHTVRRNSLHLTDPFIEKIAVKRLSTKKTLTPDEYKKIVEAFKKSSGNEREIIRRFLVLCKGLRYSDTLLLQKTDLKEFTQEGEKLYYFNRAAQKSGIAGIIAFYNEEQDLLEFTPKGYLFDKMGLTVYNKTLKEIAVKIIGREITSHYGRHYAGDLAINSGFDIDDVKAILGISKEGTARIYAQRQNTKILTKLLMYEKDKKNRTDQ
jgi:integrase